MIPKKILDEVSATSKEELKTSVANLSGTDLKQGLIIVADLFVFAYKCFNYIKDDSIPITPEDIATRDDILESWDKILEMFDRFKEQS